MKLRAVNWDDCCFGRNGFQYSTYEEIIFCDLNDQYPLHLSEVIDLHKNLIFSSIMINIRERTRNEIKKH